MMRKRKIQSISKPSISKSSMSKSSISTKDVEQKQMIKTVETRSVSLVSLYDANIFVLCALDANTLISLYYVDVAHRMLLNNLEVLHKMKEKYLDFPPFSTGEQFINYLKLSMEFDGSHWLRKEYRVYVDFNIIDKFFGISRSPKVIDKCNAPLIHSNYMVTQIVTRNNIKHSLLAVPVDLFGNRVEGLWISSYYNKKFENPMLPRSADYYIENNGKIIYKWPVHINDDGNVLDGEGSGLLRGILACTNGPLVRSMRSIFLRYVPCEIQATIPEVNMFMTQYKLLHDKIEYHTSLVISKIIDEDNIIAREVISEEGPEYLSDVEERFVRSRYSKGKYRNMIWNCNEELDKEYILMFGEWEGRVNINLDEYIHSR